jgi:hypothetical protein
MQNASPYASLLEMIVALQKAKMDLHLLVGLSLSVVWALLLPADRYCIYQE